MKKVEELSSKMNCVCDNDEEEGNLSKDFTLACWKYKDLEYMLKDINNDCKNLYERGAGRGRIKSDESFVKSKNSGYSISSFSSKKYTSSSNSSNLNRSDYCSSSYDEIDYLSLSDKLSINEDYRNKEDYNSTNSLSNSSKNESYNNSSEQSINDSSVILSKNRSKKNSRYSTTKKSSSNSSSHSNSISNTSNEQRYEDTKNMYYNCIRIFSLNAYLYNDIFRYNPHLYGIYETCRNNENRCKQIAHLCSQFDLIFLRSVYGKYQKILYDKLKCTHTILLDNVPSSYNFLNEILYTFQNYFYGNGGLYICWTKKLFHLSYYDYMFLSSDILFKRKVIKVVKLIYKEKYNLYFFLCEFDLYSLQNKMSNLDDLIVLIKKTFWKIYLFQLFYKNRKSLKRSDEKVDNENESVFHEETQVNEMITKINKEGEECARKRNRHYVAKNDIDSDRNGAINYSINGNSACSSNHSSISNGGRYYDNDNNLNHGHKDKPISTMIFRNSSTFVIGSFNIDVHENRNLYEKLVSLNGHGKMKDLYFYKNITYKLQKTYSVVDRKNTLVSGLNYCFGLTDNIFVVESIFINSEDIDDLIYLYNPKEVVKEKITILKKSINNYTLDNFPKLINKNGILMKFKQVHNYGVDILTQKKNKELSDHWILSSRIHLKNVSRTINLQIEEQLSNFIINVDKYFILNKKFYDELCEVKSVLNRGDERDMESKRRGSKTGIYASEPLKIEKYNYFKNCIVCSENINNINKIDIKLKDILSKCFESGEMKPQNNEKRK
ncbi:hypothetical protein MKS88_005437 [Plasmodium brasilianum]|nr:hypothetical protein MKS88_005437 [Plasmodium brasilianum]